mgnify:CR=1 FL=1
MVSCLSAVPRVSPVAMSLGGEDALGGEVVLLRWQCRVVAGMRSVAMLYFGEAAVCDLV